MQVLRGRSASFSKIPHGAWNGCQPPLARPSEICWSRGSCETGGPRVLLRPVALGRVLAVLPVHLIQLLGRRVPRLEVVVGQRPGRGDPVDVLDLPEVLGAAAGTGPRRTSWSPRPRSNGPAAGTACRPGRTRCPWRCTSRSRTPAWDSSSPAPGSGNPRAPAAGCASPTGQGVGQRSPARAGPDDDHVIVLTHGYTIAAGRPRGNPSSW